MKTEPNSSAYGYGFTTANGESHVNEIGLTKREHMAIEFVKACVSNSSIKQGIADSEICKKAIELADELIKQLNEK